MRLARNIVQLVVLALVGAMLTIGLGTTATATAAAPTTRAKGDGTASASPGISSIAEPTAVIEGVVYDEAGEPLDNIQVEAVPADDPGAEPVASDLTYEYGDLSSHGAYQLHVPAGDYLVRFSSPEWARHAYETVFYGGGAGDPVTVGDTATVTLDDVTMFRDTGAPVTGTVLLPDGSPAAGVDVALVRVYGDGYGSWWDETVTDDAGHYRFEGVNRGRTYTVEAYGRYDSEGTRLGLPDVFLGGAPAAGLAQTFALPAGSAGVAAPTLSMVAGTQVSGSFVEPDGDATDQYDVYFYAVTPHGLAYAGGHYYDDGDGTFSAPLVPGWSYTASVYPYDEYGDETFLGDTPRGADAATFDVASDAVQLDQIHVGAGTGRLTVAVHDSDGDPVTEDSVGVDVYERLADGSFGYYRSMRDQGDGTFARRVPQGGTYTIGAYGDTDGTTRYLGDVESIDSAATVTLGAGEDSVDAGTITLAASQPKLRGTVVDGDGAPVAGADVWLWGEYAGCDSGCWDTVRHVVADADGRYTLRVPSWAADDYDGLTVAASKEDQGYDEVFLGGATDAASATHFPVPTQTQDLDPITLQLADGVVAGTLSNHDGTTLDGDGYVTLWRWSDDGAGSGYYEWADATWTSGDRYAFRHAAPGDYVITASSYGDDGVARRGGTAGPDVPDAKVADGGVAVTEDVNPTVVPDIELYRASVLTGTLTTDDGQAFAGGVEVDLYRFRGTGDDQYLSFTDSTWSEDGTYRFDSLTPGSYAVRATYYPDDGSESPYRSTWSGGRKPRAATSPGVVSFGLGDDSAALDVVLKRPRDVTGTVLDEADQPVEGAVVTLYGQYTGGCDTCWTWLDTATTRDDGTYAFTPQEWWSDYVAFTVAAQHPDGGYLERYVGDVADPAAATTYPDVEDGLAVAPIHLSPAAQLLRGRLTTGDGKPLDGSTSLTLYRWSDNGDGAGSFSYYTSTYVYGRRFSFAGLEPGTYTVRADHYAAGGGQPYVGSWLGGGTRMPSAPGDGATVEVVDGVSPTEAGDLELQRGVVVSGTVRTPDGTPVADAPLSGSWWTDTDSGFPSVTTDADGRYELHVLPGASLQLSVYRDGFGTATFGTYSEPAVTVGTDDTTYDMTLTPVWGDIGTGAGQQLEYCLAHETHELEFAGAPLQTGYGQISRTDGENWHGPFSPDNIDPFLALLPEDSSSDYRTWGTSPDGDTLCVQWASIYGGATYQALLTKAADGGLDVTYNYDKVPFAGVDRAGYTDGLGEFGTTVVFPGGANGGYADGQPGSLTAGSLDSDVPGRYRFHFDGFADRGDAPEPDAWPSIRGKRTVGEVLTADPGTWLLGEQPAADAQYTYRWMRNGKLLGSGPTYVATPEDYRKRVRLDVRVFVPGHRVATASTSTTIRGGSAAATADTLPRLSPEAVGLGDTITLDPGTWSPGDGVAYDDLVFDYRWFRDGRRISNDGLTYTTGDDDELSTITARVVVSAPDHGTVSRAAATGSTVGAKPTLTPLVAPTFTGDAKAGQPLEVDPGTWDADGVTFTYDWYVGWRHREADAGSDGLRLTLTRNDVDDYVVVEITAHAAGHRDGATSIMAGPVVDPAVKLTDVRVHVTDAESGAPVAAAYVSGCESTTWTCLVGGYTNADGVYTTRGRAGSTYDVYALPTAPYHSGTGHLTVPADGDAEVTIQVTQPVPPPANVSIPTKNGTLDGVTPTVYWAQAQDFRVTGCATVVDPSYTVTFSDGTAPRTAPLTATAGPGDLATYQATIPAFYPSHGDTVISTNVPATCDPGTPPTRISIYIDPSGVVTDQYGRPIPGATVTLSRSDTAGGPFDVVPDGSDVMSPDNRHNPDTTNADGFFRWDVAAGWYRVKAAAPGCTTVSTNPMEVPPAKVDLLVKLTCDVAAPSATPVVTGTPRTGGTLQVTSGDWGALSDVTTQWLRDGTPIAGATGPSYELSAADVDHAISAQQTAQRPQYVQELGSGAPVEFAPAAATSDPVTVLRAAAPTAAAPALQGSGRVGTTLTAVDPAWSMTGVATTRQWQVGGTPVEGETGPTYEVRPGDVGRPVTVVYTGTKPGFDTGTVTSRPTGAVLGDAATATTHGAISGSGKVGDPLTVSDPTWSRAGVATARQWSVGGQPVAGATGTSYVVQPADAGKQVTVAFTGTQAGYQDGSDAAAPVTAKPGDAATATTAPSITGTPAYGAQLTAMPGTWSAEGLAFGYQWLRDGAPIAGADGATYTVTAADVVRTLSVRVTATRTGYADGTADSAGLAVPKLASTVSGKAPKTAKAGQKVKLVATVKVPGLTGPTGKVSVLEGRKTLTTTVLKATQKGVATLTLAKLKAGKHALTVVYAGAPTVAGSKSKPVSITVKKAGRRAPVTSRVAFEPRVPTLW